MVVEVCCHHHELLIAIKVCYLLWDFLILKIFIYLIIFSFSFNYFPCFFSALFNTIFFDISNFFEFLSPFSFFPYFLYFIFSNLKNYGFIFLFKFCVSFLNCTSILFGFLFLFFSVFLSVFLVLVFWGFKVSVVLVFA
jgi:hypothetical protein